ncbi:MAG: hypothetical protein IM604_05595 [Cytophagales bacterium]|nr:hypothetical protein [Cytophagales bacterium]
MRWIGANKSQEKIKHTIKKVRSEKASVATERNETIALGMQWSNIRLLIAMAELCYYCEACKVALCDGK